MTESHIPPNAIKCLSAIYSVTNLFECAAWAPCTAFLTPRLRVPCK